MASLDFALRALLVLPSLPSFEHFGESCLARSFYGNYGGQNVFLPEPACALDSIVELGLGESSENSYLSLVVPDNTVELVWVQEMAVENRLAFAAHDETDPWLSMDEELSRLEAKLQTGVLAGEGVDQDVLGSGLPEFGIDVLYRTPTASLLALKGFSSPIDRALSPIHKAYALPNTPFPLQPVPSDNVERVRALLSDLKYDETVNRLVNNISVPQMRQDIQWLTGERADSPIRSRHSFNPDTIRAAHWIQDQIEATGAVCKLSTFIAGFAPNVIWYTPRLRFVLAY